MGEDICKMNIFILFGCKVEYNGIVNSKAKNDRRSIPPWKNLMFLT